MSLLRRPSLPADLASAVASHAGRRPRILAWALTEDGALVALLDRLIRLQGEEATSIGWHDILRGGWDDASSSMRWVQMSTGEESVVALVEPGSFPEVFKERVEATFLFQTAVYPRPGAAVTISARRHLGDDDARVLWTAHPARGVRMDDEALAFTEAELARLRAEYAF